jgi:hypothetical protein
MENPQFEVIVENVGTIYRGSDRDAATRPSAKSKNLHNDR